MSKPTPPTEPQELPKITNYKDYDKAEQELKRLNAEYEALWAACVPIQDKIWRLEEEMTRYDDEQHAADE